MAKVSKRYAEAVKLVDRSKTYSIEEATLCLLRYTVHLFWMVCLFWIFPFNTAIC